MDVLTLGAAIAKAKSIPGSAAERSEAAAAEAVAAAEQAVLYGERAEAAAEEAKSRAFGVRLNGHTLIFTEPEGEQSNE